MELPIWLVLGVAIGLLVSRSKGYPLGVAVLVGALLGPLAFLMLFASKQRKKCPHCAEWVEKAARVCPHCQRELPLPEAPPAPPPRREAQRPSPMAQEQARRRRGAR